MDIWVGKIGLNSTLKIYKPTPSTSVIGQIYFLLLMPL